MRHACAWCGKTTRYTCDHCGEPLMETSYAGSTFLQEKGAMVCVNGPTAIVYSAAAVAAMPTSHGICPDCVPQTRRAQAERHFDRAAEQAANEQLAKGLQSIAPEKRGPTVLPRSATPPTNPKAKKP